MHSLLLPFFFLIFFSSCARFSSNIEKVHSETYPDWVLDSKLSCPQGYLCFLGSGKDLKEAEMSVLNAVSKYFEVKVDSKTNFEKSYTSAKSSADSSIDEAYDFSLEEVTKEILNGVKVSKTYFSQKDVFALGEINQKVNASLFLKKVENLEKEISALYEKGTRKGLYQGVELFEKKDFFETRLNLVSDSKTRTFSLNRDDFRKKLDLKKEKAVNVCLRGKKDEDVADVRKFLTSTLLSLGYHVKEEEQDCSYYFVLTRKIDKVSFNVKGFEKYEMGLFLDALDSGLLKVLSLKENFIAIARNADLAKRDIVKQVREFFISNQEKLILD